VSEPVVTIGGPPGSGKSTAGRQVAGLRGLEFVSAGELFREEARRRGLTLSGLSELAEREEAIDRTLDDEMVRRAHPGRLLDGRLTGPLLRRRGVPNRYIVVTAEERVRWVRLAGRDGGSVDDVGRDTRAREASERSRYLRYYGIDLDAETPDLTVDSTHATPAEVTGQILGFLASPTRSAV
jgi:cytidylate kinase